ncbi:hypothetical protein BKA57DRAFT_450314, partial [Linnemannia elongata]
MFIFFLLISFLSLSLSLNLLYNCLQQRPSSSLNVTHTHTGIPHPLLGIISDNSPTPDHSLAVFTSPSKKSKSASHTSSFPRSTTTTI